jgi:hypothetical protein
MLETTVESLRSSIEAACKQQGVSLEMCPPPPFVEAVRAGLRSESPYWQDLALQRLVELGDALSFVDDLLALADKGLTQGVRQKAKRILRKSQTAAGRAR